MPRLEVFHSDLILLTLVVDVTVGRCLWLLLVLEESVVEHLIVNVNLTHFWLHALAHLLLQRLRLIRLRRLLAQLADPSLLDKVRQLEWNLVNAALVLKISSLLCPVARHRHRVSNLLAVE